MEEPLRQSRQPSWLRIVETFFLALLWLLYEALALELLIVPAILLLILFGYLSCR